jgi:hypothetical protein
VADKIVLMRFKTALLIFATVGLMVGCGRDQPSSTAPGATAPASAAGSKGPGDPDLLASIHFVGSTALLADKKAAKLNEIASLPESADLQKDVLDKLATAPYRYLREHEKVPATATDQAALIRPLLDDLVHEESYVELRTPTNPLPETILAIHLNKDRAALWRSNLSTILTTWTGLPVSEIQAEGYSGWELKKHHPPNVARFIQAGDWVVFGIGQDLIAGIPALLGKIKGTGRPAAALSDHWLEAWANCPRLLANKPGLSPEKLPTLQLALGLKDDNVRTRIVLHFPDPLDLTLPEWTMPTNLVHNPIVNFTAVRGIAPWLGQIQFFKDLQSDPLPNQFCSWAMYGAPFETYLAIPVAHATNFVGRVGARLIEVDNPKLIDRGMGHLTWNENHTAVNWTGIFPAVAPYFMPISGPGGDFAFVGLFPKLPRVGKPPPDLFAQMMGHSNQVYYDWEITGERTGQWWNLMTLYHLLKGEFVGASNVPAQKWLAAISHRLGNAATEATVSGPQELTIVRKSPLGLASFELGYGLSWEMAEGFPLKNEYPSLPRGPRRSNLSQPAPPSAPTAVPANPGNPGNPGLPVKPQ